MFNCLRCLGPIIAIIMLSEVFAPGENRIPAAKKDRGFVLRAEKVIATEGETLLLKLRLIYNGEKPLRIDHPVNGLCQPGDGKPPWVWIIAPAGWKVREDAFRRAFPDQANSRHSGSITVKRGDEFSTTVRLFDRFSRITFGRSIIRVGWPLKKDPFAPDYSPHAIAAPSASVLVEFRPRIARSNSPVREARAGK